MGLLVRFMATATEGLSLGIYLDLPAISSAMKSPGLCPCCWQTPEELHLSQKGRGFLPCKTVSPSGTNFEYQIGEFPRGHRSLQSRFWCYIWTWLSHFTPLLYISVLLLFLPCLADFGSFCRKRGTKQKVPNIWECRRSRWFLYKIYICWKTYQYCNIYTVKNICIKQ